MKERPEGNIQKLADQLKGVKVSKKPKSNDNCTNCGRPGHLNINCWGTCLICEQGHRTGVCEEEIHEKIRRERDKKRKKVIQRKNLRRKLNEPQFELNLPDREDDSYSNL